MISKCILVLPEIGEDGVYCKTAQPHVIGKKKEDKLCRIN